MVLYQTHLFCYNLLIWLVTMATNRQNLRKIFKNQLRAVWGIKLKLCSIVSNISLYRNMYIHILFLLPLLMHFGCYGNLKFPLTYNGKNANWDLLLSHCRYFDKSFTEMFLASLSNLWILSKPLNLIGCHGNRKDKFAKNIKSSPQKP